MIRGLFKHALNDMEDADMLRIAINYEVNQSDKARGISFRRRDQLSGNMILGGFKKVTHLNS